MFSKGRVRAAGILILLTILISAAPAEAAGRDLGPAAFQPWAVVQEWWATWVGAWEKIGSVIDPHGATTDGGPSLDPDGSATDAGSSLDPSGATTEAGSTLNPHG
jgi:hypothetical protein